MTTALILNIVLATVVFAAVIGPIAWSIATQRTGAVGALPRTRRRPHPARSARKIHGVVRVEA
jgi:hypothetical protein